MALILEVLILTTVFAVATFIPKGYRTGRKWPEMNEEKNDKNSTL